MNRSRMRSQTIRGALVALVICLSLVFVVQLAAEDCISFDPNRTVARRVSGRWKVVVGDTSLLDCGSRQSEAEEAARIIRHYLLDRQCFVGRPDPSLTYYLSGGAAPSGLLAGEDCMAFDPGALEVKSIDGRWKIVEGSRLLLDFERSEEEAREALAIIRRYGFDHICFVGRPEPSMTYLRSGGAMSRLDQPPAQPPSRPTGGDAILVYGRPTCGLCKHMMEELDRAGYEYTFLMIDGNESNNRAMWDHVARAHPGTSTVTLPVMVVNGTVLISPPFADVQKLLASPSDREPAGAQPSVGGGGGRWDDSMYDRYDFASFFRYAPALERIDPRNVDYPLLQAALFYQTNLVRFNNNRTVLRYDRACAQAAQTHAEDMATKGFFSHENPHDPSKATLRDRAALFGILWSGIAENIYSGEFSGSYADVARTIVEGWMKSMGHRENILKPTHTHLGTGSFDAGSTWRDLGLRSVQVFAQLRQ